MNTAFLDAQNLAWKIHHVESGFASRAILKSYESERKHIAENLLNFDAKYAKLFSQRQPATEEVRKANKTSQTTGGKEAAAQEENAFIKTFKESCEFTSGYGVAYQHNIFNWSPEAHPAKSALFLNHPDGTHLRTGRILTPATVTRVVDANVVHLEQEIPLNGSYRIYLFCGSPQKPESLGALRSFAQHASLKSSFLGAYLRPDLKNVSYHERHNPHSLFYTICTIFNAKRPDVDIDAMLPELLARYRDHVYADDVWDQRVPEARAAAHAKMGLSEDYGGVVVVRPDGYVGCVVKLVEGSGTVDALNGYFGAFTVKKLGGSDGQMQAQL